MKDNKREISIVRSSAAIQFRKWANHIIEEYTVTVSYTHLTLPTKRIV